MCRPSPCGSLTHDADNHTAFNYDFPIALLQGAWNEIELCNGTSDTITVVAMKVAVLPEADVQL